MAINYPGSQDDTSTLPNPTASSYTNSPSHAGLHDNENSAIIALEAKLGTGSSTPSGSNLLVSTGTGTSAWNKVAPVGTIVGDSDAQSLTNKNLTGAGNIFPTFNQNTTGTAANVTGIVAIANGGTGASTQQTAINALTGTQTSGYYLRSNGTNASLSAIQAADVPTLNQNTTGTAANVTGTVAIGNGGTGQTTANAALNALLPTQTGNSGKVLGTDGTNTSWVANGTGSSPLTTKGDIYGFSTTNDRIPVGANGTVLTADSTQALGVKWAAVTGTGTVTSVSVVSANGLAGTVATATTTPAITLSTTVTGLVKGNGTALSAASSGVDYSAGTSTLATGILKSTTTTGALSIAVAGDFPTLNQNTTGTAANVTGTVAIGNGGTGQTTAAAAYNALSPMTTLGDIEYESGANTASRLAGNTTTTKKFLTQTGTGTVSAAPGWNTIAASDVPTLNQNTTGTASNVTGTVAIANGGTGQTTQAAAITALTGTQTSGYYLRSNGTNASLSAIQAADVPTLNQNTTGTASNVTGTVAIANGGTGQTTAANAINALLPSQTGNSGLFLTTNGTTASWAAASGGGGITFSVITTSQTAAVNNGYIANSATLITLTLPSTAAVGSIVELVYLGTGGWKIAQAASVSIQFGNKTTTTGTGGSIASSAAGDAIRLICTTANTGWTVLSSVGNLTVV